MENLLLLLCERCGAPATKKCSRCRCVAYCTTCCQREHWRLSHKAACGKAGAEEDDDDRLEETFRSVVNIVFSASLSVPPDMDALKRLAAKRPEAQREPLMNQSKSAVANVMALKMEKTVTNDAKMMAARSFFEAVLRRILSGGVRFDREEMLRDNLDAVQDALRQEHRVLPKGQTYSSTSSLDASAQQRSDASIESLRPICIGELEVGRVHLGRALSVKVIAPVFKMTGVMAVVEDDAGEVVSFAIYNAVPPQASVATVQRKFPVGTKLTIKEPYYKLSSAGTTLVRVDAPANVLLERPGEARGQAAEALKERGNEHYKRGGFKDAAECYSRALEQQQQRKSSGGTCDASQCATLLSNRAACWLKLRLFAEALKDCRAVLADHDPRHEKARFRLAMALAGGRRLEAATEHLERLHAEFAPKYATQLEVLRAKAANARGQGFDFDDLRKRVAALGGDHEHTHHDHEAVARALDDVSEYVAGRVVVRLAKGGAKGRGLFLLGDAARGELLLAEKPLASCGQERSTVGIVTGADFYSSASSAALAGILLERCSASPLINARLATLTSKPFSGIEQKEDAKKKSNAMAKILPRTDIPDMDLLTFDDAPLPTATKQEGEQQQQQQQPTLTLEHLRGICDANSFAIDPECPSSSEDSGLGSLAQASGIYLLTSFMNHDDLPTTSREFIGNMIFVRASRPLKSGTELTTIYFDPANPPENNKWF